MSDYIREWTCQIIVTEINILNCLHVGPGIRDRSSERIIFKMTRSLNNFKFFSIVLFLLKTYIVVRLAGVLKPEGSEPERKLTSKLLFEAKKRKVNNNESRIVVFDLH